MRAEKKRKKVDNGAAGDGWRAGMPDGRDKEGGGTAAAVLVGCLVRNKSKTIYAPRFMVLFNVHIDLFCTDADFAPMAEAVRWWCGAGGMVGSCAACRSYTPPIEVYSWDDEWV